MQEEQIELIPVDEVQRILGCSRGSIYNFMENDGWPRPIKLGKRKNAWIRQEVNNWVATRILERDRA
jgi:prophage regulatory protein